MKNSGLSGEILIRLIGWSLFIGSPVLLCFCYPKRIIGRFEKELLIACVGTISAFLFLDVIPSIFEEVQHHKFKSKHDSKILGMMVFLGMFIGCSLGLLHELMEGHHQHRHDSEDENDDHKDCPEHEHVIERHDDHASDNIITNTDTVGKQVSKCDVNSDKEGESRSDNKRGWCCSIPRAAQIVWFGTCMHNFADGMIIGIRPEFQTAFPLFIHEITHTLCNFALYISLGISKWKAISMRLISEIFVISGAIILRVVSSQIGHKFHLYGHCVVTGIFIWMMLVDIVPMIFNSTNHIHAHECNKSTHDVVLDMSDKSSTNNSGKEDKKHHHNHNFKSISILWKLVYPISIFSIAFGIVTTSVILLPSHDHSNCGGCNNHNHSNCGGCNDPGCGQPNQNNYDSPHQSQSFGSNNSAGNPDCAGCNDPGCGPNHNFPPPPPPPQVNSDEVAESPETENETPNEESPIRRRNDNWLQRQQRVNMRSDLKYGRAYGGHG